MSHLLTFLITIIHCVLFHDDVATSFFPSGQELTIPWTLAASDVETSGPTSIPSWFWEPDATYAPQYEICLNTTERELRDALEQRKNPDGFQNHNSFDDCTPPSYLSNFNIQLQGDSQQHSHIAQPFNTLQRSISSLGISSDIERENKRRAKAGHNILEKDVNQKASDKEFPHIEQAFKKKHKSSCDLSQE
ncbi:uncharacterized protein MELLADRAFT_63233 [Melampsora larici-populina 98AG31]|uniref:Secreted protein n=1 Tax=Melampsora larici-populina (strain 98AG31 / pathotype 3-4-7) TaxID=747676 RepID=F4RLX2_MELLP|nr:uncharacterized protein MELLADRAFT_63233 [Melampsora larici-populina 98AG31]EGG06618.1 hypothetical protein MELLADRAFT_63233 [Melampsora larici-populina 98AG31]